MKRREFLELLALTSTAVVATSCGIPNNKKKLVPYLVPPEEEIIPGKPLYYSSTCTECPANCGIKVKAYDKVINSQHTICPIKLEGIDDHPINHGGLCIRGQASLTRLYHPERVKYPMIQDGKGTFQKTSWKEAYERIINALQDNTKQGKDNVYLSGKTTGTISGLINEFCVKMNVNRLAEFEPFSHSSIRSANQVLFDRNEIPFYNIAESDLLITLGPDIVGTFVSPVSHGKQFSEASQNPEFEWLHIEPHITISGLSASQRIQIKPTAEPYLLVYILKTLSKSTSMKNRLPDSLISNLPDYGLKEVSEKTGIQVDTINHIIRKLEFAKKPLLITGEISTENNNGMTTALLAGLLQWCTGMMGSTIDFNRSENYNNVGNVSNLQTLATRLNNHEIGVIFLNNTDPITHTDVIFEQGLKSASLRVGFGDLLNETLYQCDIILPLSHSLESWGDANPRMDIVSIIQPALKPIFDTKSEGDILLDLISLKTGEQVADDYQKYVFEKWKDKYDSSNIDSFLKTGFVKISVKQESIQLKSSDISSKLSKSTITEPVKTPVLAVVPSLRTYDGRSKPLPLLSEIPDPLTTITYGEWVSISEDTAKSMNLQNGDILRFTANNLAINLPVAVQPKLSTGIFMVQQGNMNVKGLTIQKISGDINHIIDNIQIQKTDSRIKLPILSGSTSQEGRGIVPEPVDKEEHHEYNSKAGLYEEHDHPDYRWSMAINLESCTGCSACVAACYIENNVPITGKEDHLYGREMSWIRIEPYYEKETTEFVPMLCQHCDFAPCESVCPVYAAYHNPEGLNAQVYNRCVGTRYCANNCPYKVRRFNWFDYKRESPLDRMLNPEISVRGRGVMEKCTFCVQRIRNSKDIAKDENRKVKDGEVTPACAQSCPTNAITFGNIKDENSRIYKAAHSKTAYRIFDFLGVEPAVNYLHKKKEV